MKQIFFTVIILLLVINQGFTQNTFRNIASNFNTTDHFFSVELSEKTIRLYLKEIQQKEKINDALKGIESIKVLSFTPRKEADIQHLISLVNSNYSIKNYTPFKIKTAGINNQFIYLKEENETISDLLVISTNYSKVTLVEIAGKLDLEKIALLQNNLKIDGLESLESIQKEVPVDRKNQSKNPSGKTMANSAFQASKGNVLVFNKYGDKLMETNDNTSLMVNGYRPVKDFHSMLSELNPDCIQSIHVSKNNHELSSTGQIDVLLKGNLLSPYTVCNGMLYFGQNGYLQCITIDDDCSPDLLHNCSEKPLSSILQLEPDKIKSIELTANPRNCERVLDGEYVVIEFK